MTLKPTEQKSGQLVLPGERLGVIEEFIPNSGTYTKDGIIYSKIVGTALMEKAHAWASAMGASAVQLSVFAFNQGAVAFYKKQGYQVLSYKMALELPSGSKE